MCFSSPSIPSAPPPPPSVSPAVMDTAREQASLDYRRRVAAMAGKKSTQLTGPQGILSQASPGAGQAPPTAMGG